MIPRLFKTPGKCWNIAHRGASAYFPENTMAAFQGAVDCNADMIELDVQLSKDGVPVVFHDGTLQHHSDGNGALKKVSFEELKKLDAGSWFNEDFAGEKLPALAEVLAFAKNKIALNIEIKTEAVIDEWSNGIEAKSVALVKKYDMQTHVLFSSFDYRAVSRLKKLAPQMPVAILYEGSQSGSLLPSQLIKKYHADAFNCSYRQLTDAWVENLRSNDIPFYVYTVNKQKKMKALIQKGAAGIFTNKPDVLRDVM